jgi:hypothetical protein
MRNRRFHKLLSAWRLVALCAGAALAQTITTSINGRVTDAQGAGVAGAIITLYARAPQLRLTARTDENGAYRFERLAPGEYLLEADARGFAPAIAQSVRVERGSGGDARCLAGSGGRARGGRRDRRRYAAAD